MIVLFPCPPVSLYSSGTRQKRTKKVPQGRYATAPRKAVAFSSCTTVVNNSGTLFNVSESKYLFNFIFEAHALYFNRNV